MCIYPIRAVTRSRMREAQSGIHKLKQRRENLIRSCSWTLDFCFAKIRGRVEGYPTGSAASYNTPSLIERVSRAPKTQKRQGNDRRGDRRSEAKASLNQ